MLCPLFAADLVLLRISPVAPDSCGIARCLDHLAQASSAAPVFWLVAVVSLLIALFLPAERRFRAARGWVLLVAATCGLTALLIPVSLAAG